MRKGLCFLLAVLMIFQVNIATAKSDPILKVAFTRDGYLWIKENTVEKQITLEKNISNPTWSYDGAWIAFQKNEEIWVYHLAKEKHFKVYHSDATELQWAPDKNILAFNDQGVLNVTDIRGEKPTEFTNVALGVDSYAWLPDGKGFLVSASADLHPDGWTNPILFKIPFGDASTVENLSQKAIKFFTVPSPVKKGDVEVLSIQTTSFKWSSDGKWISFFVSPTASLSMDSNMLCVLSSDGKVFEPVAEMLHTPDWAQWSPNGNSLGYITGSGRIIFGFNNKKLTISEIPALQSTTVTPKNYFDAGFTWHNNNLITVSRSEVREWTSEQTKNPLTALYQINLEKKTQDKITNPPPGYQDSNPLFLQHANKLTWLRSNDKDWDTWIAEPDGKKATKWIENGQFITWYQQKSDFAKKPQ